MAKGIIVDDSKFMRRIIKDVLEEGGHEVLGEAENGAEGLDAFKKFRPDFVTMDITMMGKDGIEAVAEIKAVDPNAKIVVISALSQTTLKLSDSKIQATAFLTKPFEKEELLKILKDIL
ncbi:MAG: response regulator [Spirochaetes bacterium]|nr:MAG: response regulator [Spirochaetota bacterium]